MEPTTTTRRSSRSRTVQAIAAVAALLVVGLLTIEGSRAAFSATTTNGVNTFSSGTVSITDDDGGASVMFTLTGMVPGTTATRCINVTYTGSAPANVKLYGTVAGTGLATYLNTVVDVGTGATGGTGFSCTGFNDATDVNAFTNTLATFGTTHTNYGNGNGTNFAAATTGTTRSYRVTVTLPDTPAVSAGAQNLNANATFTWEAQNT